MRGELHRRSFASVYIISYNNPMTEAEEKLSLKKGMKQFTATEIASRMSYWMKKSPAELDKAAEDPSLSILDHICVQGLMHDWKYGKIKNLDLMLSRIVGTPVNQTILQNRVSTSAPVHINLVGVEVGDEDSLKALEDLRANEDTSSEVVDEATSTD